MDQLKEGLVKVLATGDTWHFARYLKGYDLPALGGSQTPADILLQALHRPPYDSTLAHTLARVLGNLLDQEATRLAQIRMSQSPDRLSPDQEDILYNGLLLAAELPPEHSLFESLKRLGGCIEGIEFSPPRRPTLHSLLRRSWIYQQVDDSLQDYWLGLIGEICSNLEQEISTKNKNTLLDAWRGYLWIPPDAQETLSGTVVPTSRISKGINYLQEVLGKKEDGDNIIDAVYRLTKDMYPRSSAFWATHLPQPPKQAVRTHQPDIASGNGHTKENPTTPTPLRYHDFTLRLQPDGGGGFTALIQHAPVGGGSAAFRLPVPPEDLAGWRHAVRGSRAPEPERPVRPAPAGTSRGVAPREVGRALFEALFAGRVRDSFVGSAARAGGEPGRGLRLRLVFDPAAPGVLPLAALPWELLYDPGTRDFLARNRETPVVRFLDVPRFTVPPPVEPPLSILVAMANPEGSTRLDLTGEQQRIEEAWADHASVEVDFLPGATLEATRSRLRQGTFQVFHFLGHGDFDPSTGEGTLLFEDEEGGEAPVSGTVLAEHLKGIGSLRLAVLTACHSAELPQWEGVDPYSGVASALVMGGLPAVVAMQLPISDRAALAFAGSLYQTLAEGGPVEAAVAEGRLAIYREDPESFEWAVPALYLRTGEGRLLEGIVQESPSPPAIRDKIRDASELIDEKTRGFVGRGFVFDEVETFFGESDRGYFLLTGEPGIGKTALVAEMARRHGWVHHFNSRTAGIYHPAAFLENVCAQLIAAHGLGQSSLPPEAIRDGGFLTSLLQQTSKKLGGGERCVLLVDALDETDRDSLLPGVNPLYLPAALPAGVYAVVSSRLLRGAEMPTFSGPVRPLELKPKDSRNLADVRELVESQLGRRGIRAYLDGHGLSEGDFVAWLVEKSAGNFMYLSYVLPAIDEGAYQDTELSDLPDGLSRYYGGLWKRMRGSDTEVWLQQKLPVLGALTVISEPLSLDHIAQLAGKVERRWVREVLGQWRPFLHLAKREDEHGRHQTFYRIYHQSFHDFLTGQDEVADEQRVITEQERKVIRDAARREVEGMLEGLDPD